MKLILLSLSDSIKPIKDWGMTITKNQIEVDEHYQTCLPGVFAVGDVCTFDGKTQAGSQPVPVRQQSCHRWGDDDRSECEAFLA
ncbi:MAG: FAD-dependent oxidoreductase [Fimbriimonadaceae bacterium]